MARKSGIGMKTLSAGLATVLAASLFAPDAGAQHKRGQTVSDARMTGPARQAQQMPQLQISASQRIGVQQAQASQQGWIQLPDGRIMQQLGNDHMRGPTITDPRPVLNWTPGNHVYLNNGFFQWDNVWFGGQWRHINNHNFWQVTFGIGFGVPLFGYGYMQPIAYFGGFPHWWYAGSNCYMPFAGPYRSFYASMYGSNSLIEYDNYMRVYENEQRTQNLEKLLQQYAEKTDGRLTTLENTVQGFKEGQIVSQTYPGRRAATESKADNRVGENRNRAYETGTEAQGRTPEKGERRYSDVSHEKNQVSQVELHSRYLGPVKRNQYDDVGIETLDALFESMRQVSNGKVNLVPYDIRGNFLLGARDANSINSGNYALVGDSKNPTIDLSKYGDCMPAPALINRILEDAKTRFMIDGTLFEQAKKNMKITFDVNYGACNQ